MKTMILGTFAAAALLASAAQAAPLSPAMGESLSGSASAADVEQVRLVCNSHGRCFRTGGPRYVQRYHGDDDVVVRRSYNYYDGPRHYGPGYGYGGGPSIGFSFGSRGW